MLLFSLALLALLGVAKAQTCTAADFPIDLTGYQYLGLKAWKNIDNLADCIQVILVGITQ